MEKNIHPNFKALSEADFKERRVVFMGAEEPAGDSEEASAEEEPVAAEATADGESVEVAETKEVRDGKRFLLAKLNVPDRLKKSFSANIEVKASDVAPDADGGIESVKASFRNIEFTIDKNTTDEQAGQLREFAVKLNSEQFKDFVFRAGSKIDLANHSATLVIDARVMFESGAPDSLDVTVDTSTNNISSVAINPPLENASLKQNLDSLKDKPLETLTKDVLSALATLYKTASEAGVDTALDEAEPKPLEGEKITPKGYKDKFKKAFKAFQNGNRNNEVFNKDFLVQDGDKKIAVIHFAYLQEEGLDEFRIKRKGTDGKEHFFSISKDPEDKSSDKRSIKFPGSDEMEDDLEVKLNDDGTITLEKVDDGNGGWTNTIDILSYTMQVKGKVGETEFESERVPVTDRNTVRAKLGDKEWLITVNGDGSLSFTPDGSDEPLELGAEDSAEGGDTDQDQDKKGRSALERTFGREASENIGSFMETLEELAAVVLELLESLGFDLNPDKNKDGTTRTPAEREGRRLWLFIGRNQLGMKNRGKLQNMKMDELMALHEDGDQAGTVELLENAEFDVKGVHGEKLYEMLEHIHNIKDKDDRNKEDGKGAEKVKEYYVANESRMTLNTFLFKTKMIDMNGRWSNGWEEFTGKTDEQKADEAAAAAAEEATKAQERTDLKNNTTLKPEVMKRIVNADKSDERNALAKKLQDMGVLTDTTAIATYDASDKTPDDFRTLLNTMSDDYKVEFFGDAQGVEKLWRDIKVELKKITPPGSTDATRLAERLMEETTKLKLGDTEITFTNKSKLIAILNKTVESYDGRRFIEKGDDKVDPELTEAQFGIREDEIQKLFKYLHEPEKGEYTDEKVALRREYGLLAGSAYTLADLIVAVFDIKLEEAPAP